VPFQKGNTLGRLRKTRIPWNKGVVGYHTSLLGQERSEEWCNAISVSKTGKAVPALHKSKTEIHKKHIRDTRAKLDIEPWNKGKSGYHNEGPYPQSYYDSRSRCMKAAWDVQKLSIKPTKPEIALGKLINEACPGEYNYTGDFSFLIKRFCPDFTNINGQKKVIEMFGNHWHLEGSDKERIEAFKSFGYDCLVIWQSELKSKSKDELLASIYKFNKGEN